MNKVKRTEESLRDLWDNIKGTNIRIIGVQKKMRKRKGMRKYLKRLQLKISPTWKRKQSSKSKRHRVPYRINPKRNIPRHILIKLKQTKHKERILKAAREEQQVTYKGNPIHLTADLPAETMQARREWQDIFKVLKRKNLQPSLLYPEKISFKIDDEIKNFSDERNSGEFSTRKLSL